MKNVMWRLFILCSDDQHSAYYILLPLVSLGSLNLSGYFENRISLKPVLEVEAAGAGRGGGGDVYSITNYTAVYEETE